jgi:hypothetical protein
MLPLLHVFPILLHKSPCFFIFFIFYFLLLFFIIVIKKVRRFLTRFQIRAITHWKMLDLQHQYNCTTIPHMKVGPTYWSLPSCEGLLYSYCIGVVQESNPLHIYLLSFSFVNSSLNLLDYMLVTYIQL